MVKQLLACALSLMVLFCTVAQARETSRLSIETDTKQVEMGKYLIVKLVYIGQQIPQPAQLHSWNKVFYIEEISLDTEHLPQNHIQTVQKLRLYPRSTGNKILHAVAQGGAIARPVAIRVVALIRNNINGTPHWSLLPETVWQGATIVLSTSIKLMSDNNQVKTEEARFPGFYLIKSWQKKTHENGIPVVQINWLLQAQNYGYFKLEAPAIIQRGRGRWRFYLPEKTIRIKPLPAYIPVTVPVASVKVMTALKFYKHQPVWELMVQSSSVLPQEIYGLKTRLAQLGKTTTQQVTVSSTQQFLDDTFTATQTYSLNVPPWSTSLDNKVLTFDYFDPKQGQLKQLSVHLPSVWLIPSLWQYVIFVLLGMIAAAAVFYLYKLLKWYFHRQAIIKAVRACESADELRNLLLQKSASTTLTEWALKLNPKHASTITHGLNEMCFSRKPAPRLADLKPLIIKYYRHRL